MAPEVWEQRVHVNSDQYALAATYFEMRTGRRLYVAKSPFEMATAHIGSQPDLALLPEAEQAVMRRALAKQPEKRYPSCAAFARALREATAPAQAPAPRPDGGWGFKVALAAMAVALVAVAAVLYLVFRQTPTTPTTPPEPAKPTVDWQPKGWEPVSAADVVPDMNGRKYYRRLVREVAGQKVVMVLVPRARKADPPTFYIMETKVWNSLYAAFLKDPKAAELFAHHKGKQGCDKVVGGEWEKGAWVPGRAGGSENLGVGPAQALLPALRMKVTEAHCFAEWLDDSRCRLPSREEYFKAAGLREQKSLEALNGNPAGLALNLGAVGPWEVKRGDRDVSPFGCRQMLTNGYEWTRTLHDDSREEIPLEEMKAIRRVYVMGTSYLATEPPTLQTINEVRDADVTSFEIGGEVMGFRVVLEE
jgi:formylglycine-generating enzyme required for sulfatase activity